MAKEDKVDIFAEKTAAGAPAYPQMVYVPDGDKKYPNGEPVMKSLGIAKNPEEHKKLLEANGWKQEEKQQPQNSTTNIPWGNQQQ